ncbi:hemicentin-1 [Fundulus heteroclitus]|uniref:hemicentin-1 n=1 Tax=Fundulus heteroclitus TaxID=8078 RepID=UPI00165C57BE|nr:hemicentin-1 [Fundulus heteroclitus]XP_035991113.1 hemicentin-1 [Fundulus heteroclitus]
MSILIWLTLLSKVMDISSSTGDLKITEEKTTVEGGALNTLNLTCSFNNSFIWVKFVFNTSVISGSKTATLITHNGTGEVSGQYMCTVQHQNATLTKKVNPKEDSVKTLTVAGESTIRRDGSLNLTCTGGSFPSFFIMWTKRGMNKTPNSETGTGTSTLVIHNLTKEHSGLYFCSTNHMNKTLVQDINATVTYAKQPEITGDPIVKEGDILNLTCTVESFPPFRITWSKLGINKNLTSDSSLDTRTSTLVTHNETTEDPGQYFCTATPLNSSTQGIIITMIDLEKLKTTEENNEGDTLNLTCRFNVSFIWTKLVFNTSVISGTEATTLITYNVTGEASGQYMCTAQYQNTTLTVTVVSKKKSVKTPTVAGESTIRQDRSLNLTCTGGSFPSFVITWTKRGINKTQKSQTGTGTSTLVIHNVTKEHSGRYFCSANHMNKTLVQDINVTVIYAKKPEITGDPTVKEGDILNLTCTVESFPPSRITWSKLGINKSLTSDSSLDTRTSTRVTHNETTEDPGQYFCTATPLNSSTQGIIIIMIDLEKLKTTEENNEGDTLNLTCRFNVSFIWTKLVFNTSVISGTGATTLITYNVTGEASGQYMCTAQYQNTTLTATVVSKNKSVKTPTVAGESTIRQNRSLNLTCTGGSFPSFVITWTKRGINKTQKNQTGTGTSTLVIHNVTKEHSGRYFCSANHMNKTLVQDINVTVIYAKKPEITGDPTVKEGDILNLTCTVESFPPSRITWSKLGINKSLTSDSSLDTRTSTRVTHNETTEDPGQYFCTATPLNSSTQGIIIIMIDLEKLKTTEENTTYEGDALNLTCRFNGSFIWIKLVFNTSVISGTGAATLITYNGTGEVSGQYMCTVQHPTEESVKTPTVAGESTIRRDGSLNLNCTGGSFPSFFITWTKQGINKTPKSQIGTGTSTLVIHNVTKEHSGRYICSATHMNKTLVQDINVTVILLPKILDKSGCEAKLEALTCLCISQGFPSPTITWEPLVNHIEYSVNTAVSNHTVRSTLFLNVKNHSSISPVCVSTNRNGEVRRKFNIITVEDEGHFTKLLRTVKQMETVIPFLIGLLLSAAIFCLLLLCFRKRQKPRGGESETLEMVMMQETNGGHIEDYGPIQAQRTAAGSESPEGATAETEYSDINVLLLKQEIPGSVEEKPKTAETDYAKIKTKGERMEEEGEAQEEEEVKLEDVAVYSVVTK